MEGMVSGQEIAQSCCFGACVLVSLDSFCLHCSSCCFFIFPFVGAITGDDPVTPSQNWDSAQAFFHDIKPPLYDQFRVTVVEDADGNCFNGYMTEGAASMLNPLPLFCTLIVFYLVKWF